MHGLIFFYLQKFAQAAGSTPSDAITAASTAADRPPRYVPSHIYPDAEAVQMLQAIADDTGEALADVMGRFGEFLAPHLLKLAGTHVAPHWRTLDLIEHTERIIHAMIRSANPGAAPPVLEVVRQAAGEAHLVYSSERRMCLLAEGLIKGMARCYGERVSILQTSCMLQGAPFCSLVIRTEPGDTGSLSPALAETIVHPTPKSDADPATRGGGMPSSIGGYTVLEVLGQGGMGRVYKARDERLNRTVAIKVLHPDRAADLVARQRFLRESRAAAAVEHPHVMVVLQVGEEAGLPYMVMQRHEGRTLETACRESGPLSIAEAVRIGRETAEGLAAAHAKGLIHRDIKPTNILLEGPRNHVRILDFGLAVGESGDAHRLTRDGAMLGTPAYMSPEQIRDSDVDFKTDLFSLGVILYELLAGRPPFTGSSIVSLMAAIDKGTPAPLGEVAPLVPARLAALVMGLLARSKADRPASANDVAAELAAIGREIAG